MSWTRTSRTPSSVDVPRVSRLARAIAALTFCGTARKPVSVGPAAVRATACSVRSRRVPMAAARAVESRSARRRSAFAGRRARSSASGAAMASGRIAMAIRDSESRSLTSFNGLELAMRSLTTADDVGCKLPFLEDRAFGGQVSHTTGPAVPEPMVIPAARRKGQSIASGSAHAGPIPNGRANLDRRRVGHAGRNEAPPGRAVCPLRGPALGSGGVVPSVRAPGPSAMASLVRRLCRVSRTARRVRSRRPRVPGTRPQRLHPPPRPLRVQPARRPRADQRARGRGGRAMASTRWRSRTTARCTARSRSTRRPPRKGIKPIIGVETYVARRSMRDKEGKADSQPFHLILLAKNWQGYLNLCRLVTDAHVDGYYYKPRIDREHLAKYSEGLDRPVGLPQRRGRAGARDRRLGPRAQGRRRVRRHLRPDGFYLELQDHGLPEQRRLNEQLLRLAPEVGLPLVVTNDLHYVNAGPARGARRAAVRRHGQQPRHAGPDEVRDERFLAEAGVRDGGALPGPARGAPQHPPDRRDGRRQAAARPAAHPALPGPGRRDGRVVAARRMPARASPAATAR